MNAPACSIVLPVRDAAATLPACLASIRRQSIGDYEVVAVDDGSVDGSLEVLTFAARSDSRVRIVTTARLGLVPALNRGLREARSDIVVRMDADDLMRRDRLARQLTWLADRPSCTIVGSHVRLFPRRTLQAGYRAYEAWLNGMRDEAALRRSIYVEAPLAHPTIAFRKSAILAIGGYRDGAFPEDYDLYLRCYRAGLGFGVVPRRLLAWRDHPDRTSRLSKRYSRAGFNQLRVAALTTDPAITGRDIIVWGAGKHARRFVRACVEAGLSFSAWIDIAPAKIGQELLGRPILDVDGALARRRRHSLILVAVTNHGARQLIHARLSAAGLAWGQDFLDVGT
ncbi:MAG: glycosyltransferase [Pseudomonadota bacterium]